ncbi:scavenger receptor cysteine-rich domain superfamily protein [Aplysia californica]|uniref:Scavenger receptor cysteine-rich domain superfamily protein n=1 Tax=Aplysia californica TaxID=6500 RepID=A0ABM0K760_APLCA|nr:scavenger receptor cysteine-rich domain superfamily protein [Aplysia californica]
MESSPRIDQQIPYDNSGELNSIPVQENEAADVVAAMENSPRVDLQNPYENSSELNNTGVYENEAFDNATASEISPRVDLQVQYDNSSELNNIGVHENEAFEADAATGSSPAVDEQTIQIQCEDSSTGNLYNTPDEQETADVVAATESSAPVDSPQTFQIQCDDTNGKKYYSTDEVIPGKSQKVTSTRWLVIAAVAGGAILVVILAIGLSLGLKDSEESPQPVQSSRLQEHPNAEPDFTVSLIVENMTWAAPMSDVNSDVFTSTAHDIEQSVDKYYESSPLADIYNFSMVTQLWPGSVGCNVGIFLKPPSNTSTVELRDMHAQIKAGNGTEVLSRNFLKGAADFWSAQAQLPEDQRLSALNFKTDFFEKVLVNDTEPLNNTVNTTKHMDGEIMLNERDEALMFLTAKWTPVCFSFSWHLWLAQVVCAQLGYSFGNSVSGEYLSSTVVDKISDIHCDNTATALVNCSYITSTRPCPAARILCTNIESSYKLVNITEEGNEDFMEVTRDGVQALLCGPSYPWAAAELSNLYCQEVGFQHGGQSLPVLESDVEDVDKVWRVLLSCGQVATRVNDCVASTWSLDNVTEASPEDSMKKTRRLPSFRGNLTKDEVRVCLVKVACFKPQVTFHGGLANTSGIVMIPNPNTLWERSAVCADGFTDKEAGLVCDTLGFGATGQAYSFNPYPFTEQYLDSSDMAMRCSNDALNASDCLVPLTGRCRSFAVANCNSDEKKVPELSTKLFWDGRTVLIYKNNMWGSICPTMEEPLLGEREATIICNDLGYERGIAQGGHPSYFTTVPYNQLSVFSYIPHVIREVKCGDTAQTLRDCEWKNVSANDGCQNARPAALFCHNASDLAQYEMSGGTEPFFGTVKVTFNGQQGYLAFDHPRLSPVPQIVCRSLGFANGQAADPSEVTLANVKKIWKISVMEDGCSELDIVETCLDKHWSQYQLQEYDEEKDESKLVKVFCNGAVSLGSGYHNRSGPVQINTDYGPWVMARGDITQLVGDIACREIFGSHTFKSLIVPEVVYKKYARCSEVTCTQSDTSLADCVDIRQGEGHCGDSGGILCYEGSPPAAPSSSNQWRFSDKQFLWQNIEVKVLGEWSVVCADNWTDTEAMAFCKYLDPKNTQGFALKKDRKFEKGMWVKSVDCGGQGVESIQDCSLTIYTSDDEKCSSDQEAYAACFKENEVPELGMDVKTSSLQYDAGYITVTRLDKEGYFCPKFHYSDYEANKLCSILPGNFTGGVVLDKALLSRPDQFSSLWAGSLLCPHEPLQIRTCEQDWMNQNMTDHSVSPSPSSCIEPVACFKLNVRLHTPLQNSGVLLVYDGQRWVSVCTDNFIPSYGGKLCQQMGFGCGRMSPGTTLGYSFFTAQFICSRTPDGGCTFVRRNPPYPKCKEHILLNCSNECDNESTN